MIDGKTIRLQNALAVLERLVCELCSDRQSFKMCVDIANIVVGIIFSVGEGRDVGYIVSKLTAINQVAAMMFRGTGKTAQIGRVVGPPPDRKREKFSPVVFWPKEKIVELLADVATAALNEPVTVTARDTADKSNHTTVLTMTVGKVDDDALKLGRNLASLFVIIGILNGRRLVVEVTAKKSDQAELYDNKTSAKTIRPD